MPDITGTTAATYLPEKWSKVATVTYGHNVIIEPLMDHTWERDGMGGGDTVFIPGFTESTSANKRTTFGTGAAVTFTATTEAQTTFNLNQFAYLSFRLPVELSPQIYADYLGKLVRDIPMGIAAQIDTELAADNTNGFDALTAIGVDNVDVSEDDVITGETVLNDSRCPAENRYFVVSPATRASLMKIEAFRSSLFAASIGNLKGSVTNGYVGDVLSLHVHMSTLLEAGTSGKKNAMFHRECIAFAAQTDVKMWEVINVTDGIFREIAGGKVYGFKLVKSTFGREVDGK